MIHIAINIIFIIVGIVIIFFAVRLSIYQVDVNWPTQKDLLETVFRRKYSEGNREAMLRTQIWVLRGVGIAFIVGGTLALCLTLII